MAKLDVKAEVEQMLATLPEGYQEALLDIIKEATYHGHDRCFSEIDGPDVDEMKLFIERIESLRVPVMTRQADEDEAISSGIKGPATVVVYTTFIQEVCAQEYILEGQEEPAVVVFELQLGRWFSPADWQHLLTE